MWAGLWSWAGGELSSGGHNSSWRLHACAGEGAEAAAARLALILEVWRGWCQVTRSEGNRIQMIEEEWYGGRGRCPPVWAVTRHASWCPLGSWSLQRMRVRERGRGGTTGNPSILWVVIKHLLCADPHPRPWRSALRETRAVPSHAWFTPAAVESPGNRLEMQTPPAPSPSVRPWATGCTIKLRTLCWKTEGRHWWETPPGCGRGETHPAAVWGAAG